MKTCTTCGRALPLTSFYKHKTTSDRLHTACKECMRAKEKAHRMSVNDRILAYKRAYRAANRDLVSAQRRAQREANHEKILERDRAWKAANPEKKRAQDRKYREIHREQIVTRDREFRKQHYLELRKRRLERARRHPERYRAYIRDYRARKKAAQGSHTKAEWDALRTWFGDVCLRCQTGGSLTADHVVPLSVGGTDSIDNLQPLCHSCNASKQQKATDYRDPEQLAQFLAILMSDPT